MLSADTATCFLSGGCLRLDRLPDGRQEGRSARIGQPDGPHLAAGADCEHWAEVSGDASLTEGVPPNPRSCELPV